MSNTLSNSCPIFNTQYISTIIIIIVSSLPITSLSQQEPNQITRLGLLEPAPPEAMAVSVCQRSFFFASLPVNPKIIKVESQPSFPIPATNKFSFLPCFYRQTREYETPQGQKQPLITGVSCWKMPLPSCGICH